MVGCSRADLQSALMNLMLNARNAMPDGGAISPRATALCRDDATTEIGLRVSDNGSGMKKEVLRRAGDPFFTANVSGPGGLGLAMVNRSAQQTGGRLDLESEPGRGTVATLRPPSSHGARGTKTSLLLTPTRKRR
jgi:signal transduction histidine kinase